MATKVQLDYDVWNSRDDVLSEFPLTELAIATVQSGLDVGHYNTAKEERLDPTMGPAERGVVAMLASSLEWLRKRGLSAREVEQRVRVYVRENRDKPVQRVLRAAYESEGISDEQVSKTRLDKNKVVG